MKLEVKVQVLEFFSVVFNFVFLALGLSLFFCAIWVLFDRGHLLTVRPSGDLQTVGAGLFLIGVVVGVVSVIGFFAVAKENRLLLLVYLGFFIVLVLGQLYVILLLRLRFSKITKEVDATLLEMIRDYKGDSRDTLMDKIQHYERCCGSKDSSDWLKNSYLQSLDPANPDLLPCSCFNLTHLSETWCSKQPNITVHGGCQGKVEDWVYDNVTTIVVMGFSLIFIQVIQFILAASLYSAIGRKDALKNGPPVDPDLAPLDHTLEDDLTNGEHNYGYSDYDDGYIDPAHPAHPHDYPEPVEDLHFYTDNRR